MCYNLVTHWNNVFGTVVLDLLIDPSPFHCNMCCNIVTQQHVVLGKVVLGESIGFFPLYCLCVSHFSLMDFQIVQVC